MTERAPFDPERLMDRRFDAVRHRVTANDAILFSLSCGLGSDPLDERQLPFVYEGAPGGLRALPTIANVLGYAGFWAREPDTGIDWRRLVHTDQSIVLHRAIPAVGQFVGRTTIRGIHDRGPDRGAIMVQERTIREEATDSLVATVTQTTLLRGDGGSGARLGAAPDPRHVVPDRRPDAVCELPTSPGAALLYRLSGDLNPLHVDPAVAVAAGFERPILHGLASMGVAIHAVLRAVLDYDESAIRGVRVRFTAPVFPGETLRTQCWRDGDVVSFRVFARERDVMVLDAGRVDLN